MTRGDEFYIGYEAGVPPGIARSVRVAVVTLSVILIGTATLVTWAARPLADARFDYGNVQEWTGYLISAPAPALLVPGPGGHAWYWLVGRGKHGADAALSGVTGGWVRIAGTLISREAWRMIEVSAAAPAAAPPDAAPLPALPAADPSEVTVRGEIVDSKCYLGVMNPGERTVHRDCAIRCLGGGVPPMIAYHDATGRSGLAVLVDARGRRLSEAAAPLAGRPIVATGRLFQVNGQPVFQLASLTGVTR